MAVFRVERNKGYTVMSNHHLRNKELSLKAKELPDIAVDELTGDVDRYKDFFAALEKTSPVPIAFENIEGGSHGYYHLANTYNKAKKQQK